MTYIDGKTIRKVQKCLLCELNIGNRWSIKEIKSVMSRK